MQSFLGWKSYTLASTALDAKWFFAIDSWNSLSANTISIRDLSLMAYEGIAPIFVGTLAAMSSAFRALVGS